MQTSMRSMVERWQRAEAAGVRAHQFVITLASEAEEQEFEAMMDSWQEREDAQGDERAAEAFHWEESMIGTAASYNAEAAAWDAAPAQVVDQESDPFAD